MSIRSLVKLDHQADKMFFRGYFPPKKVFLHGSNIRATETD